MMIDGDELRRKPSRRRRELFPPERGRNELVQYSMTWPVCRVRRRNSSPLGVRSSRPRRKDRALQQIRPRGCGHSGLCRSRPSCPWSPSCPVSWCGRMARTRGLWCARDFPLGTFCLGSLCPWWQACCPTLYWRSRFCPGMGERARVSPRLERAILPLGASAQSGSFGVVSDPTIAPVKPGFRGSR